MTGVAGAWDPCSVRAGRILIIALAISVAMGCAKSGAGAPGDGGASDAAASCATCDTDGDGVQDPNDKCPNTPQSAPVNPDGCADSQLKPTLNPTFPPYALTWTPTGDLGRAGGLTWAYDGIQRGDLFHIYWVFCDDPATPCGLSLDGPIDPSTESWQYDETRSNRASGRLVFNNTTHILLADTTTPQLNCRLTVNITGAGSAPMFWNDVGSLRVPARQGIYGAEITGAGFQVTAVGEVEDPTTSAWTPYMDYYDAALTPDTGTSNGNVFTSFGGSFYDK